MAVDASIASLLEKLKVEDPYFPPRPWESIPSESGLPSHSSIHSQHSSSHIFSTSGVSESSLVRLALNALQGVESALISIGELSYLFCSESADRSFHCIPSLWTRSSSTLALGNLLKSIGRFGCIIFLIHKFVCYFTSSSADCKSGPDEILGNNSNVAGSCQLKNHTLVNQAFAVAVGKVLEGYISALNSLLSSVSLRRSSKATDGGCLTSVGNSEITVLEVYLHTMGLRAQMEALGNICNLCDIALSFPQLPLKDLMAKADLEIHNFPRSGALITFLYLQLKAADPAHCALLKFLFLRSWEPYCGFIRSWIYEGRINDPFKEFVVELFVDLPDHAVNLTGTCNEFPIASVKVRDGVAVPIFLEDFLVPLFRAGQQLQVIMKLLELSNNIGAINGSYEEFLPGCNGFSSKYRSFSSSLTFDKGTIEAIVLARNSFYLQLLEKIDNIFSKFEFRTQGILLYGVQAIHANCGRSQKSSELIALDDNLIMPPSEIKTQELPDGASEVSTTDDEFSYAEDVMELSESSSLENFEEQSEPEDLTHITDKRLEPSYLSALSFFTSDSLQKLPQDEISCNSKPFLGEKCERKDPTVEEQSLLLAPEAKGTEIGCQLSDHILKNPFNIDQRNNENFSFLTIIHKLKVSGDSQMTEMLDCGESIVHKSASVQKADSKPQYQDDTFQNSSSFSSWRMYHSNFFNMNPSLTKSSLFKPKSSTGERWHQKEPLSCFDFTSVRDPCKLYTEKLDYRTTQHFGAELSVLTDSTGTTAISTCDLLDQESHDHKNAENEGKLSYASPVSSKTNAREVSSLANTNGGSGWVSLLGCSNITTNAAARYHGSSLVTVNEIPLDYILKKCLLDEILLQYKYLSKLTIKLFEKGFELQEHLLSLRRYHLMEVADWADLFITSLLRHKWYVLEAEKRISDIQGVLELSVQRSSCEGDLNRDRLYVYMKDAMATGPFHGIHSFDFLGLGYRVDWPISIILTPGALKIYSEIFSFLIQVKLALISLSDAWSSLKNHTELCKKNCHFEAPDMKSDQISILTKTRHQLNHFVSAVQQYVQSQLSHVSWCRFMHSLKHKVRDMMDFELVHMAYLNESRDICFLSEETQPIAHNIQQILQSAVDFRSSLAGNIFKSGLNEKEGRVDLHQTDMSQVLSIRNTFMKSIKDLYQCYLKSPKHDDFGLSHLWGYINYNEYYSDVIGQPIVLGSFPI
nr:gamma-tubulin complex component 3 [Ipomoea batatas]